MYITIITIIINTALSTPAARCSISINDNSDNSNTSNNIIVITYNCDNSNDSSDNC